MSQTLNQCPGRGPENHSGREISGLAEKLRAAGLTVALATPADRASAWTVNTLEQHAIQRRLLNLDVEVLLGRNLVEFDGSRATLECTYTGRRTEVRADAIVTVTARAANDAIATALAAAPKALEEAGIVSLASIGDCLAPSTIAAAVYAGHRYAREFELPDGDGVGFHRELVQI